MIGRDFLECHNLKNVGRKFLCKNIDMYVPTYLYDLLMMDDVWYKVRSILSTNITNPNYFSVAGRRRQWVGITQSME